MYEERRQNIKDILKEVAANPPATDEEMEKKVTIIMSYIQPEKQAVPGKVTEPMPKGKTGSAE